jgi:serine/threonine-protein kinase
MLVVTVRERGKEEHRFTFRKTEVVIGRLRQSDIILPQRNVAKCHATLCALTEGVIVDDKGSLNGTYVNGLRITGPTTVAFDDKIFIGDYVLQVQTIGADEPVASGSASQNASPLDSRPASGRISRRGVAMDGNRFCSGCGSPLATDQQFCTRCGRAVGPHGTLEEDPGPGAGQHHRPTTLLEDGAVVREYRIVKLLGAGGVGEVYLAEHVLTHQKAAVKVLYPQFAASDVQRQRFLLEAQVLASLSHDNIVRMLAFFEERNCFFMITEFIEGESLEDLLAREPVPDKERLLALSRGVLSALSHAHAQSPSVIHRDIKPGNILVRPDGRVVLTDFGIARKQGVKGVTRAGGFVGTPEYMSPEQIKGDDIGPASDIYSLGVLLYQMLTGSVPFVQEDPDNYWPVLEAHVHKTPALPTGPLVTPAMAGVVLKALSKNPPSRFMTASDFLVAIEGALDTPERPERKPSSGPTQSTAPQPESGKSSNWGTGRYLSVAVLVVLIGTVLLFIMGRGEDSKREPASSDRTAASSSVPTAKGLPEHEKTGGWEWKPGTEPGGEPGTAGAGQPEPEHEKTPEHEVEKTREPEPEKKPDWKPQPELKREPEQKPAPSPQPPPPLKRGKLPVPSGTYLLTHDGPVESKTLEGFCIDRLEVTHSDYQECVENQHCTPINWTACVTLQETAGRKSKETGFSRPTWHQDDHPAICVRPVDAADYCRWSGGRVPTSAEWEAAARGTDGRTFPWGSDRPDGTRANGCANECTFSWGQNAPFSDPHPFTAPVGSLPAGASPFGAEDMSGNVWEWTFSERDKPVARGGAWNSNVDDLKATQEYASVTSETRWNSIGFRCVYSEDECR